MYRCTHLRTHLRTHMRTCTLTCAHNMRVFKNPRAHLRIHMHIVHALYVCVLLKNHVYDLLDSANIYSFTYSKCGNETGGLSRGSIDSCAFTEEPDVISFNSTLSTFQDGTSWSIALQVLEQMEQSHLEPETRLFFGGFR